MPCSCHVFISSVQVLASLAEEPQEFAKGLEVLDSIVKIYTVFSRCAAWYCAVVDDQGLCTVSGMSKCLQQIPACLDLHNVLQLSSPGIVQQRKCCGSFQP